MKFVSIVVASLGGFLFGYNTAIIAGVMLFIKTAFNLSPFAQGWAVSSILLGALVFALAAGYFADAIGRKKTILLSAVCFCVGCFIAAYSNSLEIFCLGRFITGLGLGLTSVVSPMYMSEISSAKQRGTIVAIYQFAITIGILAAYMASYVLSREDSWRTMLKLGAIAAILQLILSPWIAESPRWLFAKLAKPEAKRVAEKLCLHESIEESFEKKKGRFADLFANHAIRLALLVGLFLSIFQQITGINAIIYFAPQVFEFAGFSSKQSATLASLGLGIFNVIATALAVWLLDKAGRKILLCLGSLGMAVSLIFSIWHSTALIGLMSFISFFAIGLGPVTWVVISEIFPLKVRAKAISLAILVNWLFNYIVSLFFLSIVNRIGIGPMFLIFACLCVICFFFLLQFLPETKGKKLNEIHKLFEK